MNEFRCCLSVRKPMLARETMRTARVCKHHMHGRITHTSRQHLHTTQPHLHFFSVQLGRSHFLQPALHVRLFFHPYILHSKILHSWGATPGAQGISCRRFCSLPLFRPPMLLYFIEPGERKVVNEPSSLIRIQPNSG